MKLKDLHHKYVKWIHTHMSEYSYTLVLSVVVGLASGLAAVVLKTLVHTTNALLLGFSVSTKVGGNILIFFYPAIGIILTVLFVKYIVKGNIGHGIPEVLLSISRHQGELPAKNMWSSLVASTITVAFGGSVGLEAPIASTGSAIGSNIGRWSQLDPRYVKMLLGCGAAGAIAGIFNAPIAGMLFVVEVLMFDFTKTSAIPLLLSALSSSVVAFFLMGDEVQFAYTITTGFELGQIPFYIILGAFCALSSIHFLRMSDKIEARCKKVKKPMNRMLIGGLALGLMIYIFPPLFGEGYGQLNALLNGHSEVLFENSLFAEFADKTWAVLLLLLLLIFMKVVATATTIGSGGVGGTFGPSLIVGGISGYFVATFCNFIGMTPQDTSNFALVGMAAVMSGVMHAPLMATFLIAEITGGYGLMVPLLLASATTLVFIRPFEKHSIYARKLALHGDLLTHDKDSSAWQLIDMRKLIETDFVIVREGDKLRDLVEAIKNSRRNVFPVLTEDDKFLGAIHIDSVRKIMFKPELYDKIKVVDLINPMTEGDMVHISDSPSSVVDKFQGSRRYNIIVLDDDETYLGILSRANTFSAYRTFVAETSEE